MIKEDNLLFIISQPRSGSSLLQQLLLSTGKIYSIPEPWLLLALTQVYRETSNESEFNPNYSFLNFKEYLNRYEKGREIVVSDVRSLILKLYNFNEIGDKKYFLDKTPRYYHIINEIKELFPASKIIIILRNPISVFASILDYNFGGDVQEIFRDDRLDDLYKAPRVFAELINKSDQSIFFVKYEDLVTSPDKSLNEINEFLALDYVFPHKPEYIVDQDFLNTQAIDRKGVINNTSINDKYLNSWKQTINDKQKKYLLIKYLRKLGPQIVSSLGYDFNEILKEAREHPVKFKLVVKQNYLFNNGDKIGIRDFITSIIATKFNKFFNI